MERGSESREYLWSCSAFNRPSLCSANCSQRKLCQQSLKIQLLSQKTEELNFGLLCSASHCGDRYAGLLRGAKEPGGFDNGVISLPTNWKSSHRSMVLGISDLWHGRGLSCGRRRGW